MVIQQQRELFGSLTAEAVDCQPLTMWHPAGLTLLLADKLEQLLQNWSPVCEPRWCSDCHSMAHDLARTAEISLKPEEGLSSVRCLLLQRVAEQRVLAARRTDWGHRLLGQVREGSMCWCSVHSLMMGWVPACQLLDLCRFLNRYQMVQDEMGLLLEHHQALVEGEKRS